MTLFTFPQNLKGPLENRINQEGNQWSCSLFSLKELLEGQTTVYCPWDDPA